MADVSTLLYEQSFSSQSSIVVTHNQGMEVEAQVVVGQETRQDLVTDLLPSESDPLNEFTVTLSSAQSGIVQVFQRSMRATSRLTSYEKAVLSSVVLAGAYFDRDASGFLYPHTATDDIAVGGASPSGRWFDDGDLALGVAAMSGAERLRSVGGVRIEKSAADAVPGLYLQASASHPAAQQGVLLDIDVNSIGLDIDSEATGKPLINLQGLNGNSRGDIAFGTARAGDPSAPAEGDFWYQSTTGEFRFRKSATTVDVRDAIKLQGNAIATTAPTDDYVLAWNATASEWQPTAMDTLPGPDYTQVTATASTTTTSTTDTLMSGMTMTPAAGQYTVFFSTTLQHSNNGQTIWVSIYAGGVQEAYSEKMIQSPRWVNAGYAGFTQAIVTVDGSQAIELRWRTSSGTATALNRSMMIVRVS